MVIELIWNFFFIYSLFDHTTWLLLVKQISSQDRLQNHYNLLNIWHLVANENDKKPNLYKITKLGSIFNATA